MQGFHRKIGVSGQPPQQRAGTPGVPKSARQTPRYFSPFPALASWRPPDRYGPQPPSLAPTRPPPLPCCSTSRKRGAAACHPCPGSPFVTHDHPRTLSPSLCQGMQEPKVLPHKYPTLLTGTREKMRGAASEAATRPSCPPYRSL